MKHAALGLSAVTAFTLSAHAGAPVAWLNAVNGDWNNGVNWSSGLVPAPGDSVLLGLTGAYTVTTPFSQSAASLDISNPQATLAVSGFRTLTLDGDIINDGQIVINWNQINTSTRLLFNADAVLSGSGSLLLNNGNATAELATGTGILLTQAAGHTITGVGRISANFVNEGLVLSDTPGGVLTLGTSDKNNNSDIRAENGGSLSFETIDVVQGPAGRILVDGPGSEAIFGNTTLDGGLLSTQNGGRGLISFNSTFRDVTLEGATDIAGFRTLVIEQGVVNNGVLTVNFNNINTATSILLSDGAPISGSGQIVLNNPATTAELASTGAGVSVHGAGHTIRGRGRVSAAMVNQGLISADLPTMTIELTAQPKTNNARIEAVNGGAIAVQNITVTQGPGASITADGAGSTTQLSNATIVSGLVEAINGGVTVVPFNSTVQDVVMEGPTDIQGFRTLNAVGTVTNNGVITVNSNAINTGTAIRFEDGAVLAGSGSVILANPSVTATFSSAPGASMTHAAAHTIEGIGRIDAAITNNGLINANVTGQTMEIVGPDKINNASILADNGALLSLLNTQIVQGPAGVIRADGPGAVADLSNATITGGVVESANGGLIRLTGNNATLNAVALRGEVGIGGFRFLGLDQNTTLDGRITVNTNNINTGTGVSFVSGYTLQGQGVIRLANPGATAAVGSLAGVIDAGLGAGIRLEGIGRVQTPLTIHGEVAPGLDAVGTLEASHPIEFSDTTNFEIEVSANNTADRLASTSTFQADGTLDVAFVDAFDPPAAWSATIVTTNPTGVSGAFDTVNAPQPTDPRLEFRVVYRPNEIRIRAFCRADTNADGLLNFFDVTTYIASFNNGDPAADIAAPIGTLNFFDLLGYIARFNTGCP